MAHVAKFQKQFHSSVCQDYSYMIEYIFNIKCIIAINKVKYGSHVFKVVKIDVISTPGRSLSCCWNLGK